MIIKPSIITVTHITVTYITDKMISIKKSQIRRKKVKYRSDLVKKFSALNIESSHLNEETVNKWIIPIYTKTYYDPSSFPLQQTSIYSYIGRELINVGMPESVDLKLFLFERLGLSVDEKYVIHYCNDFIFIFLTNPFSVIKQSCCGWNNILTMFRFDQPDREPYRNPYSAILHGYCNDQYDKWYKPEITTQLKLQNSSKILSLKMIFQLCEKLV